MTIQDQTAAGRARTTGGAVDGAGRGLALAGLATIAAACSPTLRVEPPDKPIEINLNVKIEQEVRIRVDRELEQLFENNDDIF